MANTPDNVPIQRKTSSPDRMKSQRSSAASVAAASSRDDFPFQDMAGKYKFRSYRLAGEYQKPWLTDPGMKKTRWNNLIVGVFILLGFAGAGVICFFTVWPYREEPHCLIWEDDFQTLDTDVWSYEVQLDRFGTGSFDWTTRDERNAYVDGQGLHIVQTLTNETASITNDELYSNYTLDLSKSGECTGDKKSSCRITSDPVEGTMIPPVKSARLSTKGRKSIRYGRVEVEAKLPKGDWIWPAICELHSFYCGGWRLTG